MATTKKKLRNLSPKALKRPGCKPPTSKSVPITTRFGPGLTEGVASKVIPATLSGLGAVSTC